MINPWKGPRYGKPNNVFGGVRLLVLGESAHAEEYEIGASPENLAVETVAQFLMKRPRPNWRFFKMVTTLLAKKDHWDSVDEDEIDSIWNSLAFTNYVSVVAAKYSRTRPTHQMFVESDGPFRTICKTLYPEAILVCGLDNAGWLARSMGVAPHPWETPRFRVTYDGGDAIAARVKHPSTGFTFAEWRPVVDYLLESAGKNDVRRSVQGN